MAIVGCDVDGVLADIMTPWLGRYNHDWDDNLKLTDIKTWGIDKYVKPECGQKIYGYLKDPTLYDEALPYDGALEFIKNLKEAGHRVVYVTACTPQHLYRKFQWLLDLKLLKNIREYITASDKSLVCTDWLVDDSYENTSKFKGQTALIARPWNEGRSDRCFSYEDAFLKITGDGV